jgi:hypothetical protein
MDFDKLSRLPVEEVLRETIPWLLRNFPARGLLSAIVRASVYDLDNLGRTFSLYDFVYWTRRDPGTILKIFKKLEADGTIERKPWSVSARGKRPTIPYSLTTVAKRLDRIGYAA